MKRNFIAKSSLVVMSLLLSGAGAYAQAVAKAHVPFAFTVGAEHEPAGTYTVTPGPGSGFIKINNVETGKTVMALISRRLSSHNSGKLIFRHVGSQYSLMEIWGAAGTQGMGLPIPKANRKLEVASAPAKPGNTFEIALK